MNNHLAKIGYIHIVDKTKTIEETYSYEHMLLLPNLSAMVRSKSKAPDRAYCSCGGKCSAPFHFESLNTMPRTTCTQECSRYFNLMDDSIKNTPIDIASGFLGTRNVICDFSWSKNQRRSVDFIKRSSVNIFGVKSLDLSSFIVAANILTFNSPRHIDEDDLAEQECYAVKNMFNFLKCINRQQQSIIFDDDRFLNFRSKGFYFYYGKIIKVDLNQDKKNKFIKIRVINHSIGSMITLLARKDTFLPLYKPMEEDKDNLWISGFINCTVRKFDPTFATHTSTAPPIPGHEYLKPKVLPQYYQMELTTFRIFYANKAGMIVFTPDQLHYTNDLLAAGERLYWRLISFDTGDIGMYIYKEDLPDIKIF